MAIFGYNVIGGTGGNVAVNQWDATGPFVAPANGTIDSIEFYGNQSSGSSRVTMGVYNDVAGVPTGSPVAVSAEITPGVSAAWQLATVASGSIVSGNSYWIVIIAGGANSAIYYDSSTPNNIDYNASVTYSAGSLPSAPSVTQLAGLSRSIRVNYTPSGGSGAIAGTDAMAFTQAGALTGAGALAGADAMAFTNAGVLIGTAPISGVNAMTFANTGTLAGPGAISGADALIMTNTGTMIGLGALAGLNAMILSNSGTLAQPGAMLGTNAMQFGNSGAMAGNGALAGLNFMRFVNSGSLVQPPQISVGGGIRRLANFSQYKVESESDKLARRQRDGYFDADKAALQTEQSAVADALLLQSQLDQYRQQALAAQAQLAQMAQLQAERNSQIIEQKMLRKRQEMQMAQLQQEAAQSAQELNDVAYIANEVVKMLEARNR